MKTVSSIGRNQTFSSKAMNVISDELRPDEIWIERKRGIDYRRNLMNADDGTFQVSNLYDRLIQRALSDDDVT